MKKFLLLLIMCLVGFGATEAQNKTWSITPSTSAYDFRLTAADTVVGSGTWYAQVNNTKLSGVKQSFQIKLDSIKGGKATIGVQGKIFPNDSWTAIGSTVRYGATTSDSTITITKSDAFSYYQYYRIYVTMDAASGKKLQIIGCRFKFWEE